MYSRLKYSQVGIFLNARNERFVRDILSDARSMTSSLERFIGGFITNSILFVGISSVLVMTDWRIFLVLIISTIIMYFLEKIRHKLSEKMGLRDYYHFQAVLSATSSEMTFNFPQLISSGAFSSVLETFSQTTEKQREMSQKNQNSNFVVMLVEFVTDNFTEIAMKLIV